MITKNDCLTILVSLEDRGINIDQQMKKLITSKEIPMDTLKFILDNRGIDRSIKNIMEVDIPEKENVRDYASKAIDKQKQNNKFEENRTKKGVAVCDSFLFSRFSLFANTLEIGTNILNERRTVE